MFQWFKTRTTAFGNKQQLRCRPAIEGLESRECLSTSVSLTGTTLNIIGDNANNNVQVTLREGVNDIQVNCDPIVIQLAGGHKLIMPQEFHFSSMQVQNLNINLKGGDDTLRVQLGADTDASSYLLDPLKITANLGDGKNEAQFWFGGLDYPNRALSANLTLNVTTGSGDDEVIANFGEVQFGSLRFNAFLGAGNDTGFAGLWGNIDPGATVLFNLQGQGGNDTLNTYETYNGGYDHINIAAGAFFDINMDGGAGNDQLNMTYGGDVEGKLRVREIGGLGNDGLNGDFHPQAPSNGAIDAVFQGSAGRDHLEMDFYGQARIQRALIDGGTSDGIFPDTASSIGDVQIIHAMVPPTTVSP